MTRSRTGSTEDWVVLGWCEFPTSYHFAERLMTYTEGAKPRELFSTIRLAPMSDAAFEEAWARLTVEEEALRDRGLEAVVVRAFEKVAADLGLHVRKGSAMFCEHANECPARCPCTPDCYCRTEGTCR